MYLKYLLTCAIFLVIAAGTYAQTPTSGKLDLNRVIRLVIDNHPAIKQAQQYVAASGELVAQKQSAYLPELEAHGSYSRIGPVPSIEIPDRGKIDFYPRNNYDFHLALRQTILDFGRRPAKIELARSLEDSARDNVDLKKSSLVYRAIGNFYLILLLERNMEVLDEELDALNLHLTATEKRVKAGTATDFDVLTTRVRMSEAENMRIDVANELEKQRAAMRELIGFSQNDPVDVVGDFTVSEININQDSLIESALQQLPEARLSRQAEATADIQYRLDGRGDRPTLDMIFDFGFKNGYVPDLNKLEANWVAGLQVDVPVFNGFLTRHKKAASYANLIAARENTSGVRRQIASNVRQAIAEFEAAKDKVKTSQVQVEYAESAVSIARSRYEIGVITNLDLLDAQTSLAYAKLSHLKSLYGLVRGRYELYRAVGYKIWR